MNQKMDIVGEGDPKAPFLILKMKKNQNIQLVYKTGIWYQKNCAMLIM